MEIHAIGIDLGKTLFHLVGVDANGGVVVRKRCSRTQLLTYTANVRVHRSGWRLVVERIFWVELCARKAMMCD